MIGTFLMQPSSSKHVRTLVIVAALIGTAAACASSSKDASTDAIVDASSTGVCCPVENGFQSCAGTHEPGGWASSASECADPRVVWGGESYLVARVDAHGCAILVAHTNAATCAGAPPVGAAPVGGGVCCPANGNTGCEGTHGGAGGWAPRSSSCSSSDWNEDVYLVNASDVHGCAIIVNDATVCACECQPDASIADAPVGDPTDASTTDANVNGNGGD